MAVEGMHPAAPHHLPGFFTAPGETDILMVVMVFVLAGAVLGFGVLFLRLHSLPEQIAHKSHKLQFEIVAVLGLISLFTHMHIFWIIGLILALIDFPDFGGWMARIAGSVEKIAGKTGDRGAEEAERPADIHVADDATKKAHAGVAGNRRGEGTELPRSERADKHEALTNA
jgi:hypothetical protein